MKAITRGMICLGAAVTLFHGASTVGQTSYQSTADFENYARKLRETALMRMEPPIVIPTSSRPPGISGRYPWKTGIVTTVFWIGSGAKETAGNSSSAWDQKWMQSYGGYDDPHPSARRNFIPANFVPRQNPFYTALPYNDVAPGGTKPEARQVIPWFKEAFVEEGKSVCRDRWVAIRNSAGKICYAQWSDCGPFRTDHWQYVFGNEKPKPNPNQGAGLNVSPAVRDFLALGGTDVTDWKFVDFKDVPAGPWSIHGENNDFVQKARRSSHRAVDSASPPRRAPSETDPPVINLK
jgi:hypothetical protein